MTLTRFQSKGSVPADSATAGAPGATNAPLDGAAVDGASTSSSAGDGSAPKVHVVTFGCQMNKYDSLLAEGRFQKRGYEVTGEIGAADVIVFNTCSVREHAEERTYSWLGELKRAKAERPDVVIAVMGCMAQRVGEEIFARAGHVDIVAGTRQFHHLPEFVDEVRGRRSPDARPDRASRILALQMEDRVEVDREAEPFTGGLHGYLTVMRGCDLNCTYCIVPTVRGRVLSRKIEALVTEAEWMIGQGARVITLLGQTVNSYGEDFAPPGPGERHGLGRQGRASLADLIYRLQELDGLDRIRLITLHPSYVSKALAQAIADCDKAERFLPLPAQSGSDRVLRAMKRGYTTDLYRRRVDMLREHVPDIELGSDWIVGFPGETEDEYRASEEFLAEQAFAVNYIFKYDPRPTTSAAEMLADDVPEDVKKDRNQRLLRASEQVALRRLSARIGETCDTFVEGRSDRDPSRLLGRTLHTLPIQFAGGPELVGRRVRVRVSHASAFGLRGELA